MFHRDFYIQATTAYVESIWDLGSIEKARATAYLQFMMHETIDTKNAYLIGLLISVIDGTLPLGEIDLLSYEDARTIDRITQLVWDIIKVI